jgi:hypothetical protein
MQRVDPAWDEENWHEQLSNASGHCDCPATCRPGRP